MYYLYLIPNPNIIPRTTHYVTSYQWNWEHPVIVQRIHGRQHEELIVLSWKEKKHCPIISGIHLIDCQYNKSWKLSMMFLWGWIPNN